MVATAVTIGVVVVVVVVVVVEVPVTTVETVVTSNSVKREVVVVVAVVVVVVAVTDVEVKVAVVRGGTCHSVGNSFGRVLCDCVSNGSLDPTRLNHASRGCARRDYWGATEGHCHCLRTCGGNSIWGHCRGKCCAANFSRSCQRAFIYSVFKTCRWSSGGRSRCCCCGRPDVIANSDTNCYG